MKDLKIGIKSWDESDKETARILGQFDKGVFPGQPKIRYKYQR